MNHNRVTADGKTLMDQAPATADIYFRAAVRTIEDRFGEGAAEKYPQMVAAHMNASALDFGASLIARALEAIADRADQDPLA